MTITKRQKILELAEDLAKKCDDNGIWYSLTDASLLGAARHGGFVPWIEKFQINILANGLRRLKELFHSQLIDSSKSSKFKKLTAAWVPSTVDWENMDVFVEIKILIPTTTKKLRRIYNPFLLAWDKLTFKKTDIKYAINNLTDNNHQGYFELENFYQKLKFNWHQTYTFETIELSINGKFFKAPKKFHQILKKKYGEDYMTNIDIPFYWDVFDNPVKSHKES